MCLVLLLHWSMSSSSCRTSDTHICALDPAFHATHVKIGTVLLDVANAYRGNISIGRWAATSDGFCRHRILPCADMRGLAGCSPVLSLLRPKVPQPRNAATIAMYVSEPCTFTPAPGAMPDIRAPCQTGFTSCSCARTCLYHPSHCMADALTQTTRSLVEPTVAFCWQHSSLRTEACWAHAAPATKVQLTLAVLCETADRCCVCGVSHSQLICSYPAYIESPKAIIKLQDLVACEGCVSCNQCGLILHKLLNTAVVISSRVDASAY